MAHRQRRSGSMETAVSLLGQGREVAQHALAVGPPPREELEGQRRLEDRHAASVERAAPQPPGVRHQLGLQWPVHHLGDPQAVVQQVGLERRGRVGAHPRRRGVDQPIGAAQLVTQAVGVGDRGACRPVALAQGLREPLGAVGLGVTDHQFLGAERQQAMRDRRPRAARADQNHAPGRHVGQPADEALLKALAIGVVPDGAAVIEDDGVDRVERGGIGRQAGELAHHLLLAGVGDVDPAEAQSLGDAQQAADGVGGQAQRGDVQPLVHVAETEVLGLALVQRRAERGADIGADETDAVAGVVDREDHGNERTS